jgi:hypothetical protein
MGAGLAGFALPAVAQPSGFYTVARAGYYVAVLDPYGQVLQQWDVRPKLREFSPSSTVLTTSDQQRLLKVDVADPASYIQHAHDIVVVRDGETLTSVPAPKVSDLFNVAEDTLSLKFVVERYD